MGLKVWLPLNGTLENNMLNGIKHSSTSGTVSYTTGKIGQALSCNGSTYCVYNGINLGSDATICCWSKTSTSKKMKWVLVCDSSDFLNIYESSFYALNTGDSNNNPFKDASNSTVSVITDGKWHHFAVTFGNNLAKLYIDGQYRGTAQTFRSPACTNGTIKIAGGYDNTHTYDWNGALNDFRIYDHCLSPKEISELSQALILHYTLDNVAALMSKCENITWNQLARPTNASQSTAKNVTYSRTDRKYLNIQTTLDGVSGTGTQIISTNYLTEDSIAGTNVFRQQAGHKYYSPNTLPQGFYFAQNVFTGGVTPFSGSINTGVRLSNQSTIQQWSLKGNGGTVVKEFTQCPLMMYDLTMMFGEGNEPTKEEFDMMFPYSYYPYDTGTIKNLKIPMPDCSGYKRNGTITGTLSLDSSTPRYRKSTAFDGVSYVQVDSPSTEVRTIAFWAKWNTIPSGSGQSVVFVDQKSKMGFGIMSTGLLCSTNGVSTKVFPKTGIVANQWYHFAIVNTSSTPTATTRDLYINGVKQTPTSSTSKWAFASLDYLQVGKRSTTSDGFAGKLSDFRMYATALSGSEILDLYNSPVYIDDSGTIGAFEFVENSENGQSIEKTGVVGVKNFIGPSDNLRLMPDGSVFLRLLRHNNPESKIFTEYNCWLNSSDTDLYSSLILLKNVDWMKNLSEYEFLACEKLTSSDSENQYRWKQTSNPATTSSATGFQLVSGTAQYLTAGLANAGTHGCFDLDDESRYWCCCGSYTSYQGGIPGFNGVVTTGYMELFIRIPNEILKGYVDGGTKFFNQSIVSGKFKEI